MNWAKVLSSSTKEELPPTLLAYADWLEEQGRDGGWVREEAWRLRPGRIDTYHFKDEDDGRVWGNGRFLWALYVLGAPVHADSPFSPVAYEATSGAALGPGLFRRLSGDVIGHLSFYKTRLAAWADLTQVLEN